MSIQDLPIEILQAILVECPTEDIRSIILTSKRWNLSCVSCPRLWTRLHIDMSIPGITAKQMESYIRTCYLRSATLLLDISLEFRGFVAAGQIQAIIFPNWAVSILRTLLADDGSNAAKWNSLQIVWPHIFLDYGPVLRYFEVPMPNLKLLDLSLHGFAREHPPRFPHLPLLEHYIFRETNFGSKVPFDDSVLSTIRTLTCATTSWNTKDGKTFLKFQHITVLRLWNFNNDSRVDSTFPSKIELPLVQTLHLCGTIPIFESLLLPSIRKVILEHNAKGAHSRFRMVGQLIRWKVPEVELRVHNQLYFDQGLSRWVQDLRLRCWGLKELVMDDWLYDLLTLDDLKQGLDDNPMEAEARTVIMGDASGRQRREYRANDEEWLVSQTVKM